MTEKRYFKKMWEEEFYIFDSNTISESDFEEKLEYQDYKAFEDSMMGDEVVNRLNKLNNENKQLQQELFDSECECIEVHYHDNEVRRDDRIEDLKIEFKERFGRDFE